MLSATIFSLLFSLPTSHMVLAVQADVFGEEPAYGGKGFGGTAGFGEEGGMPTEAEFLEMQRMMEEEINNYVNTLSEEEQIRFHQLVEEETKKMEAMSEEELNNYVQQMLIDIDETTKELPQPAPTPIKVEPTPAPVVTPEVKLDETEKALKIINNIITNTESFLRKAQRIPELPGKITQWVEKDKVSQWQVDLTWETLQGKIENLNQKLIQLKERDPKTKKYRYIGHLLKKENTYNNLVKLRENLNASEPLVVIADFGLGPITKESRAAIQKVLSAFAEAIYVLDLPEDINKVIAEFEPRAKEIRDEEETNRKRALEESKKGIKESPRKEVGGKGDKDRTRGGQDLTGGYDQGGYYPGGGRSTDYPDAYDYDRGFDQPTREKSTSTESGKTTKDVAGKDEKSKDEARSKELKAILELIDQALVSIEEVIVMSNQDTIKKYIETISRSQNEEVTKKKDTGARKNAALELRNAATSLRKAKRKMKNLVKSSEKQEVINKIKSETEFMDIVKEMSGRNVTPDSPEELQALQELANAISAFYS
jgi:hypothetical protein